MSGWEKLISFYQRAFYLPFIYELFLVVTLIAGFIFHRDSRLGKFFLLYLSLDLAVVISDDYIHNFLKLPIQQYNTFVSFSNIAICLVELYAYLAFYELVLHHKKIKNLIPFFKLLFLSLIFIYGANCAVSFNFKSTFKFAEYIAVVECLILLVLSFTYFIELFSENSDEILPCKPSFWISIGIFQLIILSIPYYLVNHYLFFNKYKFYYETTTILFYAPLAFNYIMLTKAFACKKSLVA